ncbi:hypothetical protein WA158_002262 [Blastocystis sp. Blastoise]
MTFHNHRIITQPCTNNIHIDKISLEKAKKTMTTSSTTVKQEKKPTQTSVKLEGDIKVKSEIKEEVDSEEEAFLKEIYTAKKMGQTRPTPSPGQGDRVFYESLNQQNPDSFMALKWCVEHGIFEEKESKKQYERLQQMKLDKKAQLEKRQSELTKSSKKSKKT